jgi:GAF domain-containing protein
MSPSYTVANLKQSLESLLQSVSNRMEAAAATLHLYNQRQRRLYLPIGVGLLSPTQFERGVPHMRRVPGQIVRSLTPIFADDAENYPGLAGPFTYRERVKSVAGLPLKGKAGEPLGVTFLNYRTHRSFTLADQQIFIQVAEEFGRGIERILEDFSGLQLETSLATAAFQTSGQAALQEIVDSARNLLPDTSTAIWMFDEERNGFAIQAAAGLERQLASEAFAEQQSQDMVVIAFAGRKKTLVENVTSDRRFLLQDMAGAMRWQSAIGIPILSRYSEPLGVFCAYAIGHFGFTKTEENILESFATLASGRIESERKIESLNALHDLATRLTQPLQLDQTLKQIVEAIPRITRADVSAVHLYNATKQDFYGVERAATFGADLANLDKPRAHGGSGEQVIREGLVVCDDVDSEPHLVSTFVKNEGIKAYVGVRLWGNNQPQGILYVSYRRPHKFTEDEIALIRTLGYYASTAISRAQLLDQRQTFQDVVLKIATLLDKEELLHIVTEHCEELLGCEIVSIGLLNEENNQIDFKYAVGEQAGMSIPLGEGLISVAIETRRPVRVSNAVQHPRYYIGSDETRSELDIPLLVGDRLLGVLNAESKRLDAFTEEHEKLGLTLASQIALALYNIELFEAAQSELEQRVKDISALREVYAAIGVAHLEEVLQTIARRAIEITSCQYAGIYLLDRQRQELYFGALEGGNITPAQRGQRFSLEGPGINALVARTGKPYRCLDTSVDNNYFPSYPEVHSELTVPLQYGGRLIGTLDLESKQVGAFTDDHLHLIQALAGAAAAAVRNVWLYEDMRTVSEVGQALTEGVRLREEEILELIRAQASKLMNTNDMYIALYDEATDTVSFGLAVKEGKIIDVKTEKGWELRRGGQGRTEWIVRNRKSLFHATAEEGKKWYAEAGHKDYIGETFASWMGVPMVAGDKVLGMIAIYHPDRDYVYSQDDLTILQTIADPAAIALDNAKLYYDVNQRLQTLIKVGERFSSGIQLKESDILKLIYEQAQELTGTKDMYIALYDEGKDEISFKLAMKDGQPEKVGYGGWADRKINVHEQGRTEEIILTRRPILHRTYQEALDWYKQPNHQEFLGRAAKSYVGVPMITGEKVLGVLAISDWEREYVYDESDQNVLLTMANYAAIAIENARLYRKAREDVIASGKLATLGAATATLQHRISNTLNIIVPNLSRLQKRVDINDPTIAEIMDIIERNIRYTSDIVRRIQEPLRELDKQEIDINAVIYEAVSKAQDQWQADPKYSSITITLDLHDAIPLLQAPIGQVSEVFRNLIDNAGRVMTSGGQLTISSQYLDDRIVVKVSDTGPGIPSTIQDRLFEKPVASKEPGGGTGLGLWLNRLMVQSIGGAIRIEKTGPTGTTILVELLVRESL